MSQDLNKFEAIRRAREWLKNSEACIDPAIVSALIEGAGEKEITDWSIDELATKAAKQSVLEIHDREFRILKAKIFMAMSDAITWRRAKDKEAADAKTPA